MHVDPRPFGVGATSRLDVTLAETSIDWCTLVMKQASPAEKLLAALELQELGLQMKKTQIRRNHPDATPEEVDQLFLTWLLSRKPLPDGFRVISWPRR